LDKLLKGLNDAQLRAVTSSPHKVTQIIAGPGTGKTSVLTSRIAYLLINYNIEPCRIIVTTFTKKAAKEMVQRLNILIAESKLDIDISKLIIGTFHSVCVRILRQYGKFIGLNEGSFKIADERDSNDVIRNVLKNSSAELKDIRDRMCEYKKNNDAGDFEIDIHSQANTPDFENYNGYDPKKIRKKISSLKSNGQYPQDYEKNPCKSLELLIIYKLYQDSLQKLHLVDFDDLLLKCLNLLQTKQCLTYIKHVFVDEFQDTNKVQLELMYQFCGQATNDYKDNVSIVGDPDQSIYKFRNAVAQNFEYMKVHYRYTEVAIFELNQNYRSTSSILNISEKLMTKANLKQSREAKNLKSQHKENFEGVYKKLSTNLDEADFIANEISHLLALPELFDYKDFAILLRSGFHSRAIEQSLRKRNIPYNVLQGKAFWDQKEINAIINYLRAIVSDNDKLAIMRTVNLPARGIGAKSLDLLEEALDHQSDLSSVSGTVFNNLEDLIMKNHYREGKKIFSQRTIDGITEYINLIKMARMYLTNSEGSVKSNLTRMFDFIVAKAGLAELSKPIPGKDSYSAELNLEELKSQMLEFELVDQTLPDIETGNLQIDLDSSLNSIKQNSKVCLAQFLESIGLYEAQTEKDEVNSNSKNSKVVISTIHGAKGLEWPVVFVPCLTDNFFPASWATMTTFNEKSQNNSNRENDNNQEALEEERRILYVATTRAKTLLYLTSFTSHASSFTGNQEYYESRFIVELLKAHNFANNQLALNDISSVETLYKLHSKNFPKSNI
ncbi:hypothetical protein PACTADRAFT_24656, partial [Pachysolen tannophilus NRRL Y-2460]